MAAFSEAMACPPPSDPQSLFRKGGPREGEAPAEPSNPETPAQQESRPAESETDSQPWNLLTLFRRSLAEPGAGARWFGSLGCAALFLLLFRDALWHFYYAWTTDENYSHGFLVPLIAAYFADQAARRGPVPVKGGTAVGAAMLGSSVLIRLVTIPLPIPFVGQLGFIVGLTGLFGLLFGSSALRRYWFTFTFLVFMVPLPVAVYTRLASPLQLLASQVAAAVMNATGVPVLREGNHLTLPGGVQLFVAEACSGMRQLTGFLALTTAVAYLWRRPAWYRAVIVLSAVPIALTANITRVLLTGYIMHFLPPKYALGTFHTVEGLLMMGFGLVLLNLECWLLDRLDGLRCESYESRVAEEFS
jgi:exosortase